MTASIDRMALLGLYSRAGKKKQRFRRIGPEAALQIAVVEHLRLASVSGCFYMSIPNEGKRSPQQGAHLKRMGLLPGASDLLIKIPEKAPLWLELKARGEELRDDQILFSDVAIRAGFLWNWADNIDAALRILTEYGALRIKRRS